MKVFSVFAVLLLTVSLGVSALDGQRIAYWENEFGLIMNTEDKTQLSQFEKDLSVKSASSPGDMALKVRLGIVYHNLSRALQPQGVRGNAAKAADLFQAVMVSSAEEELKVVALSYLGSSMTLQGNEDSNPVFKISFVNQGMDRLNEGVSKYSRISYIPSLLRANVTLSLPDFFKQLEVGGADLQSLETQADRDPKRIPVEVQSMVQNLLGNYYKKKNSIDKAILAWKKSVALDPDKLRSGKSAAKSLDIYAD